MAQDITTLVLGVETEGKDKAVSDLGEVAAATDKAATANDNLGESAERAAKRAAILERETKLAGENAKDSAEKMQAFREKTDGAGEASGNMATKVGLAAAAGTLIGQAIFAAAGHMKDWVGQAMAAAEQTYELSLRLGIAAEDIAGVRVAFQTSGVQAGEMQMALSRVQQTASEGKPIWEKLGISVRDSNGEMKSSKDLLYELAGKFEGTRDSADKTAAAVELFGQRLGYKLLPMLTEGKTGLRDMADLAERLGLVIDTNTAVAGDRLSDALELVNAGLQAVITRAVGGVLPALSDMADQFLRSEGFALALKVAAELLGAAFDLLVSFADGVITALTTVGVLVGGLAAAFSQLASGSVRGAGQALKAMADDLSSTWERAGKRINTTFDGVADGTKKATGETLKLKDANKKTEDGLRKYTASMEDQLTTMQLTTKESGKHATSTKLQRDLNKQLNDVTSGLTKVEADRRQSIINSIIVEEDRITGMKDSEAQAKRTSQESIKADKERADALKKHLDAQLKFEKEVEGWRVAWYDAEAKRDLNRIAQYERVQDEIDQSVKKADEMVAAILRETDQLKMSDLERQISIELLALERTGLEKGSYAYETYAEKIRAAVVNRAAVQQSIDESKKIADNWNKLTDQIGQGLTDSLFRAFESGKNFFDTLWSGIRNLFKTTVLRMLIQPVQAGITGAVGSLMGAPANAAAGGTDWLSLAGSGASAIGLGSFTAGTGIIGGIGDIVGGAIGAGTAGTGIGASIGTGLAGVGSSVAAAIPYVAVAALAYSLYKKFDKSGTPHSGASIYTDSTGASTNDMGRWMGSTSGAYNQDMRQSTADSLTALNMSVVGMMNALGGGGYAAGSAFASDNTDPSRGYFSLTKNGTLQSGFADKGLADKSDTAYAQFLEKVTASTIEAINKIGLPEWAQKTVDALGEGATLEQLATAAAAIANTTAGLKFMGEALDPLGGVFSRVGELSSDAKFQLAEFAGGIESLISKTQSFVEAYYSNDERAAISAKAITTALTNVGIDASISTKEEFRKLVDSTDVSTEQGRLQLATLLTVATDFSNLSTYLKDSKLSLAQVATGAANLPLITAIEAVTEKTSSEQVEATAAMTESVVASNESMAVQYAANNNELSLLNSSLNEVLSLLRESSNISTSIVSGMASMISSITSTNLLLRSWDDGGAIVTTPAV